MTLAMGALTVEGQFAEPELAIFIGTGGMAA